MSIAEEPEGKARSGVIYLDREGVSVWRYSTLLVKTDASGQVFAEFSDMRNLRGWDSILNHFARQGWELVNAVPSHWGGSESYYVFFRQQS